MLSAILGIASSAGPGIMKAIKGSGQIQEGRTGLASLERPKYGAALNLAKRAYGDQMMPGEANMYDRSNLNVNNIAAQASEAGNPLAILSSIQGQENKSIQNIASMSAQHREQDRINLSNKLDTAYQMNEYAPYAEKSQEYRDMVGAGEKNQYEGMSNLFNLGAGIFGAGAEMGGLDSSKIDEAKLDAAGGDYFNTQSSNANNPFGANAGAISPDVNALQVMRNQLILQSIMNGTHISNKRKIY